MRGQQGIAGHLGAHLAIAQDEVREDREHRSDTWCTGDARW